MPLPGAPSEPTELAGPSGTRFRRITWFREIDSTNRHLLDLARAGAAEGAVAVADYQSAGRGRLGRRWEAPPGENLLASVLLVPELEPEELHLATAVVALSAASACRRVAGVKPGLKWPNDLVVGERKLAGVLAESLERPGGRAVVVGIGMNVGWAPPGDEAPGQVDLPAGLPSDLPASLPASLPATSLAIECGHAVDRFELLGAMLEDLDTRLGLLATRDGRIGQAREYRSACTTLGKRVRVLTGAQSPRDGDGDGAGGGGQLQHDPVEGEAVDVTVEGHLLVRTSCCLETIAAGDVVHLRT